MIMVFDAYYLKLSGSFDKDASIEENFVKDEK